MTNNAHIGDDRLQARREAAALLGVNIDHLTPADALRLDMVSALRLVIDAEQGNVLSGGSADIAKLNIAVSSLIALLPGRELPEPESQREDPRVTMFRIYQEMRQRGELHLKALPPESERIAELEAEIERLRGQLGLVPAPKFGAGPKAELKPPVIEAKPAPTPPAPVPAAEPPVYDYDTNDGWRAYVEPDGSIRSTPMTGGKWWGPV